MGIYFIDRNKGGTQNMNNVGKLLLTLMLGSATFSPMVNAESKGTVLITGANRGIGLALAAEFSRAGFEVIGTARKPDSAQELAALDVPIERLDVTSQESVDALASRLSGRAVDILINNAGIIGHNANSFRDLEVDRLAQTFNVNVLGPLRVTQALLPNLMKSEERKVINMSSQMGSMELNRWDCCHGYSASKAALNSINKTLSVGLGGQGMIFVVLHPGYVKTDMNDGHGEYTAEQSAAGLLKVITGLGSTDNGKFYDFQGKPMPW
jgi:NAD(P)-dependent dehydrogenase (short-subunit alcohol dehydrogenase family)